MTPTGHTPSFYSILNNIWVKVEETGQTISGKDRRWCKYEETPNSILLTFQFAYRGDTITLEIIKDSGIRLKDYNWSSMPPTIFKIYLEQSSLLTAKTGASLEKGRYLRGGTTFGKRKGKRSRIPHKISGLYTSVSKRLDNIPLNGIKILFICEGNSHNKGIDIVENTMRKILKEMKDVYLIVKTKKQNSLSKLPRTINITGSISEKNRVSLYNSCDILLAPYRGGGYAPDVLKAMTRGLIVIISNRPAIRKYADPYALVIDNKTNGSDPDPEHTYRLLYQAITNVESLKKDAKRYALELRER